MDRLGSLNDVLHSRMNGYAVNGVADEKRDLKELLALQAKLSAQQVKPVSAISNPLPLTAIPSSDVQSSHLPSRAYFGKNLMAFRNNSFEFPNSSVENSPCNGDPYLFTRPQQVHSNSTDNRKRNNSTPDSPLYPKPKSKHPTDLNPINRSNNLIPKRLRQLSSPLDDKDSPSSPCTVEMSGTISHSCSFQSDGFASEEVSATATLKLFSCNRAVSAVSPSTGRLGEAELRSPLVLAAGVWEKKVQDIETTFQQLQTQIRDLEGAFGQIGQFGQFFYPGMMPDDIKSSPPALQSPGALVLDMPKINFKRSENNNFDRLFQNRYPSSVPYLPQSSSAQQHRGDCRVEEIEPGVSPLPEEPEDCMSNSVSEASEGKS